jgi:hypothetical protein
MIVDVQGTAWIPEEKYISNRSLHRVTTKRSAPVTDQMILPIIVNTAGGRRRGRPDPARGDRSRGRL